MKSTPSSSPIGQTRRTFLKHAATATAAMVTGVNLMRSQALGATSAPVAVPGGNGRAKPGARLTIGVIGLGGQGMWSLRNLLEHGRESNVRVGAVCDLWDKRREAARQTAELPPERAFEHYQDVIALPDIDAVVIATHDVWHARIAIAAMEAGKHVYLEKPMTRYLHEAFAVYDAAKRTGVTLQVGTQHCANPIWTKSADLLRADSIGPLVLAQSSYMRNAGTAGEWNYGIDPDLTPRTVDWKTWLGESPDRDFNPDHFFRWRKYFPYCAGLIGDLMPHRTAPLLLAIGATEFPSRVVSLGTRAISTDRDVCDNAQMIAEFPSGYAIQILSSSVNEQGVQEMIRGHHATLKVNGERLDLNPERPFADQVDSQSFNLQPPSNLLAAHQKNWISCIRDGSEPLAGPEVSIRVQTILSLAEMSERLNIMCLFDEKTRQVTTGDGRTIDPITYGSLPV